MNKIKRKTPKLTALRSDILTVISASKKPLGAYDILAKLKKKRPNAEPPTVYRVLDYLVENKLVHRIDSQNLYVACSQSKTHSHLHKAILLFCSDCQKSYEFEDNPLSLAFNKFAKKNSLAVDDSIIEIKGTCQSCLS